MIENLRLRICVANWSALPAPLWFLIASPALHWAMGDRGLKFTWPHDCSRSPLDASFWHVARAKDSTPHC